MMTNAILRGKPDDRNPYVRVDEGSVASAKPRAGGLRYNLWCALVIVGISMSMSAASVSVSSVLPEYCVIRLDKEYILGESLMGMSVCPTGGWTDEYMTSNLVLKLIHNDILNGITNSFYIGVFEVTQSQYQHITGKNPSKYKGDRRPVECVSWLDIKNDFLPKLSQKIGGEVDLPWECEWEYACRAGSQTKYNNGSDDQESMRLLGRFSGNTQDGRGGGFAEYVNVGSYLPNAWGLYDMHGNVWEWCLDDHPSLNLNVYKALRGGSWYVAVDQCTSSSRMGEAIFDNADYDEYGFRIVLRDVEALRRAYAAIDVKSSTLRSGNPEIMDVVYRVASSYQMVDVRVCAFSGGNRSLSGLHRVESFVDGTETNVGDRITANVAHKIGWLIPSDYAENVANLQLEVLAKEGPLLQLNLVEIPENGVNEAIEFSWNACTEEQVFNALLWLYASKAEGLKLENGVLKYGGKTLASGTGLSDAAAATSYILSLMGFETMTAADAAYIMTQTGMELNPNGVRQYGVRRGKSIGAGTGK